MKRLLAVLTQRCPVCLQGKVFHGLLAMNTSCPHCGLHFDRETGYFLNAMFAAYGLGFLVLIPVSIYLAIRQVSVTTFSLVTIAQVVILWPLIFRYSRVIWLHVDQVLDPRTVDSGTVKQ